MRFAKPLNRLQILVQSQDEDLSRTDLVNLGKPYYSRASADFNMMGIICHICLEI